MTTKFFVLVGLILTGLVLLCAPVSAQPRPAEWIVEVIGGPVSPSNPSVQVRLSALFSPLEYAFAGATLDVSATGEGWSQPQLSSLPGLFIGSAGTVLGKQVMGINAFQPFLPLTVYPSTNNPIQFWEATWNANDFRPRMVEVHTATSRFDVYPLMSSNRTESRLNEFTEGSAFIQVIPAPAGIAVHGAFALFAGRCGRESASPTCRRTS